MAKAFSLSFDFLLLLKLPKLLLFKLFKLMLLLGLEEGVVVIDAGKRGRRVNDGWMDDE